MTTVQKFDKGQAIHATAVIAAQDPIFKRRKRMSVVFRSVIGPSKSGGALNFDGDEGGAIFRGTCGE
jgi:hypothetical protein